ncbi:AAA family ATPase [Lyngbya sp. CCY1209]|uniref:AAA family ATPase n=1 Tax=Lyngbya sp. CCY1209 TaxID=2886103 RepID=UPI002D20202C|nr:AAA family ATPase [Lyngbya sp. CCY1209]MEB3884386.1 AAA family ATPase [Lyngbya sp. CCY1209]
MDRKTRVILCNYTKGGAGKTTVAVHIARILTEQTPGKVLLMDCDSRPDSWKFFAGQRPSPNQARLSFPHRLDLWWNPPQSKGARFKPITKREYKQYNFVVIDADAPPEDALTLLDNTLPDIFLVPIAESQSHATEDIPIFLEDLEREIRFQRDSGIDYNPTVKIAPLGLEIEEIEAEVDIRLFSDIEIEICVPMQSLDKEIRKALKEKNLIWEYPNLADTKSYFINLIKDKKIPEVN